MPEDCKQLRLDFAEEFDRQEIKDKNGRTLSPKTNIKGSKSTVWLHEESGSGIPHLHAAVCRVDENGNTNNDRNIHLCAQRAAERIARKRAESADRRISVPTMAAYIILAILVWQLIFLAIVMYANTKIR